MIFKLHNILDFNPPKFVGTQMNHSHHVKLFPIIISQQALKKYLSIDYKSGEVYLQSYPPS